VDENVLELAEKFAKSNEELQENFVAVSICRSKSIYIFNFINANLSVLFCSNFLRAPLVFLCYVVRFPHFVPSYLILLDLFFLTHHN